VMGHALKAQWMERVGLLPEARMELDKCIANEPTLSWLCRYRRASILISLAKNELQMAIRTSVNIGDQEAMERELAFLHSLKSIYTHLLNQATTQAPSSGDGVLPLSASSVSSVSSSSSSSVPVVGGIPPILSSTLSSSSSSSAALTVKMSSTAPLPQNPPAHCVQTNIKSSDVGSLNATSPSQSAASSSEKKSHRKKRKKTIVIDDEDDNEGDDEEKNDVMQQRLAMAQRRIQLLETQLEERDGTCRLCFTHRADRALSCGHMLCYVCLDRLPVQPPLSSSVSTSSSSSSSSSNIHNEATAVKHRHCFICDTAVQDSKILSLRWA
jgi:hypothetical protein